MQLALFDQLPGPASPPQGRHRDVVGRVKYALPARVQKTPGTGAGATLEALDDEIARLEREAYADATKRNYRRDWNAFVRWCHPQELCALPASAETLRRYLAHLATSGYAYSTIRHARSSIGLAHAHARLPRPDEDPCIRMLERGIAREQGGRA